MHAINIKGLKKTYNGTKALEGINIDIAEGEFFGLQGRMEPVKQPQ